MQRYLTNAQMRAADEYTIEVLGISGETLMQRAGIAIADEVEKICAGKSVLVVCGTGNNGGDGYVCAQKLLSDGVNVSVYAMQGMNSHDCHREKLRYAGEYVQTINADIIVDCLFGTGLSREITGGYADVINRINASGAYVVSADIPSGINGDNGLVMGVAVKAQLTVTIAEYKLGFLLGGGKDYCGKIIKKDIGICPYESNFAQVPDNADIKEFFPARPHDSHKGTFGTATLISGCPKYVGAPLLATEAALRSGCGYVRLDCPSSIKKIVAPALPQTVFGTDDTLSSKAIAIGMGSGVSKSLYNKINYLLKNYDGALIIDADGLNSLAKYGTDILTDKKCNVILTPHVKEFARLTDLSVQQILSNPVFLAQSFAKGYGVTLLLKGSASIICGDGKTYINPTGCSALAKAGSGDMLSGYMCGTAARGVKPVDAAACAQYVIGLAAQMAAEKTDDYVVIASDILACIPEAVTRIING